MGDAYREERRWTEARDAYLKALELFPDNIPATLHLAEALTYTGDPEGAVAKLEKARRLGAPLEELQQIKRLVRQDG
jgi:cytochrome c-type biogenesis protein CcmH/NrfG